MDSGLLKEITYDVLKPRLPSEIIGIMDQILCHEVRATVRVLMNRGSDQRRQHGILAELCRRRFSPPFIWKTYSLRPQRQSKRLYFRRQRKTSILRRKLCYILCFVDIFWQLPKHAALSLGKSDRRIHVQCRRCRIPISLLRYGELYRREGMALMI